MREGDPASRPLLFGWLLIWGMCGYRDGVATGENKLCCGRRTLYSSSLIDQLTPLTEGAISEAKPTLSKVYHAFYGSTAHE